MFVLCEELHWGFFFFRNKVLKRHHRMFSRIYRRFVPYSLKSQVTVKIP